MKIALHRLQTNVKSAPDLSVSVKSNVFGLRNGPLNASQAMGADMDAVLNREIALQAQARMN
jgi:hypothetical protein